GAEGADDGGAQAPVEVVDQVIAGGELAGVQPPWVDVVSDALELGEREGDASDGREVRAVEVARNRGVALRDLLVRGAPVPGGDECALRCLRDGGAPVRLVAVAQGGELRLQEGQGGEHAGVGGGGGVVVLLDHDLRSSLGVKGKSASAL